MNPLVIDGRNNGQIASPHSKQGIGHHIFLTAHVFNVKSLGLNCCQPSLLLHGQIRLCKKVLQCPMIRFCLYFVAIQVVVPFFKSMQDSQHFLIINLMRQLFVIEIPALP